jgi:DNA-binding Lrp family transcriptional regulator
VEEIILKLDLADIRILELLKENSKILMREIVQLVIIKNPDIKK